MHYLTQSEREEGSMQWKVGRADRGVGRAGVCAHSNERPVHPGGSQSGVQGVTSPRSPTVLCENRTHPWVRADGSPPHVASSSWPQLASVFLRGKL